jgi:hypothetical protein
MDGTLLYDVSLVKYFEKGFQISGLAVVQALDRHSPFSLDYLLEVF